MANDTPPVNDTLKVTVDEGVTGPVRLDAYLAGLEGTPNRSSLKLRSRTVTCNGRPVKLSAPVTAGDRIEVVLEPEETRDIVPEDIPLDIIYEDSRAVVVNKPPGMVVHPGAGNWSGTLLHALAGRYRDSPFFTTGDDGGDDGGDPNRPGIVHRLDKDTGGVLVVARNGDSYTHLVRQFARRRTRKIYLALVKGSPVHSSGSIAGAIGRDRYHRTRFAVHGELRHSALPDLDTPVDGWREKDDENQRGKHKGRPALTTYTVLRRFNGYTLLKLRLHTGRTHQLRVHLAAIGHPVVGDPIYARADRSLGDMPLMLHARQLEISLAEGETRRSFRAPLSRAFREGMRKMQKAVQYSR
ncbi:MAG: RluA family pseudouridine synthase [Alkalispirochaeta sp.]